MKTSIHLVEQIIRAKTALHLKLLAHQKDGKVDIGGRRIDDLRCLDNRACRYSFNKSRISVRSFTSGVGSGGDDRIATVP